MTVYLVLLKNITSENRMRRYFLKCRVNLVQSSLLVSDNRICRGSRCLLGLVTLKKKVVVFPTCLDFYLLCSPDCTGVCREVVFQRLCICTFIWILALGTCLPRAGGLSLELLGLGQGYSIPQQGQTLCGKCRFPPSCLIVW